MFARKSWFLLLTVPFLATACIQASDSQPAADTSGVADTRQDTTPVPQPRVTISGNYGVVIGETVELVATTTDGTDTGYGWASADEGIATVDELGVVTALAIGETTVTATGLDSGATGTHGIVVVTDEAELPIEIEIIGAHGVEMGQTLSLTARTINGADAEYAWESLDPDVATVAADGMVTPVAMGETTVTATGSDTAAVGRHALVVTPAPGAGEPEIPFQEQWASSGHADKTAEAFVHWNQDDPAVVPVDCARCHSSGGFQDYIGEDGSAAGVVDQPAPIGTTVECTTCHNATTATMSEVTFPSGVTVGGLGSESRCMTCHQGRASGDNVDQAILAAAAESDDTPSAQLGFLNIHYYAAGATLFAGRVRGGYQYAGQVYDWRFRHVEGLDSCVGCHNPHSLEVKVDECAGCHKGVESAEDARQIRMVASLNQDYDGDGNTTEGIYFELEGLQSRLYTAIQAYTAAKGFGNVCYDSAAYPYWFIDTNGDKVCGDGEAAFPNRYVTWSPRLVRAAYNYQVSLKDPGAYAHNAKYIIQLLHDSIADISEELAQPSLLGDSVRNDFGHFNGASEAARHWDSDESVSASCSKCHGGSEGLRFYLNHGVSTAVLEQDNGLDCETCHENFGDSNDLVQVNSVTFPGGKTIASDDSASNLCSTCHSGRASKADVDAKIATGKYGFVNVHYLPSAAVRQGADARVGYQYEYQDSPAYAGQWTGHTGGDSCNSCHSGSATKHSFRVEDDFDKCQICHQSAIEPSDIRNATLHGLDYDGDGDATEPLAAEVAGLREAVMAAMQGYATAAGGAAPCYDEHAYPYFFIDTNNDGVCGEGEAISSNKFAGWDPALMKAAHNFQISVKDPGAWAHNFDYIGQLLYDSLVDLEADVTGLVRP